jgi:hypothetical protein
VLVWVSCCLVFVGSIFTATGISVYSAFAYTHPSQMANEQTRNWLNKKAKSVG